MSSLMGVKRYECAQILLLIVPVAALLAKFFIQTRLTLASHAVVVISMFNQIAVSMQFLGVRSFSSLNVGSTLQDDVYYCDELVYSQETGTQLVTNGINLQLACNTYSIQRQVGSYFVDMPFELDDAAEFTNFTDQTSSNYLIIYQKYNLSGCQKSHTAYKYVVVSQSSIKPISVGFSYKFDVLDARRLLFYTNLCSCVFVVSIFVVIFWIYFVFFWQQRRQAKFDYFTTGDNYLVIDYTQ